MATANDCDTDETILKKGDTSDDETPDTRQSDDVEGYNYEFVDELKSKEYECPICLHVVRNPLQIPCGDIACKTCWNNWASKQKSKNEEVSCPLCRDTVGTRPVIENIFVARLVRNLQVYCINYNNGCQHTFVLSDIEKHQVSCGFQSVTCDLNCGEMILLNQQKHHIENDCPKRQTTCPFCQSDCDFEKLQKQRDKLDEHHTTHVPDYVQKFESKIFDLCERIGIFPDEDALARKELPVNLAKDIDQTSDSVNLESVGARLSLTAIIQRQDTIINSLVELSNTQKQMAEKQGESITSLEQQVKQQMEQIESLDEIMVKQNGVIMLQDTKIKSLEEKTMKHITSTESLIINTVKKVGPLLYSIDIHQILTKGPFSWQFVLYNSPDELIRSKPFYTKNKFLCCFHVYINSVYNASCIELFLLKGEYDDEIMWPFRCNEIKGGIYLRESYCYNSQPMAIFDNNLSHTYPPVESQDGQTSILRLLFGFSGREFRVTANF